MNQETHPALWIVIFLAVIRICNVRNCLSLFKTTNLNSWMIPIAMVRIVVTSDEYFVSTVSIQFMRKSVENGVIWLKSASSAHSFIINKTHCWQNDKVSFFGCKTWFVVYNYVAFFLFHFTQLHIAELNGKHALLPSRLYELAQKLARIFFHTFMKIPSQSCQKTFSQPRYF